MRKLRLAKKASKILLKLYVEYGVNNMSISLGDSNKKLEVFIQPISSVTVKEKDL